MKQRPIAMVLGALVAAGLVAPLAWNQWSGLLRDQKDRETLSRYAALAEAAFEAGDPAKAAVTLNRVQGSRFFDGVLVSRLSRYRTHLMAWDPEEMASNNAQEILLDIELTEEDFPGDNAITLAARGHLELTNRGMEKAKLLYDQALAGDPDCGPAHLGLALLYRRDNDDIDLSVKHLRAVLEIRPQTVEFRELLGSIYLSKNDMDSAIAELESALKIRDGARTRAGLGRALLAKGRFKEAARHLDRSTRMEPDSLESWADLGQAHFLLENFRDAEAALRTALEIRPTPAVKMRLATLLNVQKRHYEAFGILRDLAAANDRDPVVRLEMAVALQGLGKPREAAVIYRELMSLADPDDEMMSMVFKQIRQRAAAQLKSLEDTRGETP